MSDLVLQVSPVAAVLGSLALSFSFVGSLYIWRLAGYRDVSRDDTGTIQRRFLSALLTCLCSALLIRSLAQPAGPSEVGASLAELLGFTATGTCVASAHCLGITALLFLGPLAQHAVSVMEGHEPLVGLVSGHWIALRNYALAPFTEEFVFRACVVRLLVSASFPWGAIIFCSPFCFALAHAHHFVEHVRRLRNKQTAMLQVAFQVFYTSLFGMYSNFLLLRTGSTVAVILTHSFCNHQGFPDLGFLVSDSHPLHRHRPWLGVLYVAGMLAFCWLLGPATQGFAVRFGA